MKYDYLIVGCGPFGATIARRCLEQNKTVLIIDKRNHIAGNTYTEFKYDTHIHKYGPHIFHTSSEKIWKFVNRFAKFNNYTHKVVANYFGKLYSLPFNMWTFNQFWGVSKPEEVLAIIEKQKLDKRPSNLEEQAISMVGQDIYNTLIKSYTYKQWNKNPKELPANIITRIPIRLTYNDNYFDDIYQGIPENGYTSMIRNMIEGATVELSCDFLKKRDFWENQAKRIIYTGPIDSFYNYEFDKLSYRSLFFEETRLNENNFQGISQMNFTDEITPYTRIIEHKHFDDKNKTNHTVITKEYPVSYDITQEAYYPINDEYNSKIYLKYKNLTKLNKKYIFGGRLAEYKYYDMHQAIGSALAVEL